MSKAKNPRDKSSQEPANIQPDPESGVRPESDGSRPAPRRSKDGGRAAPSSDKTREPQQTPPTSPSRSPVGNDDDLGIDYEDDDSMRDK
jgi:hypothetical protein